MRHEVDDKYENLVTGEHVVIVSGYQDVNPNNEPVNCYNLQAISINENEKVNRYHITESTLDMYYQKIR